MNELGNERKIIYVVFAAITTSVTIGAFGPKILGKATNHLFYGFLGKRIPAGVTKVKITVVGGGGGGGGTSSTAGAAGSGGGGGVSGHRLQGLGAD